MKNFRCLLWLTLGVVMSTASPSIDATEWSIPIAGNAFRTDPALHEDRPARSSTLLWKDHKAVYSVYFRVDRPATLSLSLRARTASGSSSLTFEVLDKTFTTTVESNDFDMHEIGSVTVPQAAYVRLDMHASQPVRGEIPEIQDVVVKSDANELELDYVRNNDNGMFYWGRRGPSVHLRYVVPTEATVQYAYGEVTVPEGLDTIGSFFMANGFGEGYFGMQVNGPQERRVLFSVWSPFSTDNPRDIPADQRIESLAVGPDVRIGEFGNEGSGGQSILVYPWRAGVAYRFLTEVKPDGIGSTVYTSWFGPVASDKWRLIASFRRPKTTTHLTGFHSFLENFSPAYGHIERMGHYGNVWVCDTNAQWHACTQARFSVDPTGGQRHRLDFAGGAEDNHFYLRNCGFFDQTGTPGEIFTLVLRDRKPPSVDFDDLPGR